MSRDDFSPKGKALIAHSAGYLCSKPDCRAPTAGPTSDERKVANVGQAAHITAASPGGPRYDPNMTPEERSAPSNGIWLCAIHAKLVDDDESGVTVEVLRFWKAAAELRAAEKLGKPAKDPASPLVASYNQTGGQTALFIHNEGPQRRTLRGLTIRKDWLEGMKARPVEKLVVVLYSPDGEVQAFAKDVALFAKDVGWTKEVAEPAILWGPPLDIAGVHITSKHKDDPSDPLRIFATWLHRSGFEVSFGITPSDNRIHIAPV